MTIDKGLGFIRNLNLSWLDAAALARLRNNDFQSMRQDLDQHLKHEIAGDESRRKTIDVLVAIWYRSAEIDPILFNQALDFFSKVPANERIWLHYGLTLLYYPFFRQTAAIVGQFARTGEPVTRLAVKGRLAKEIGHLGSLNRAAERVVASLVDWGALSHQKKGNIYLPQLKAFNTNNNDLQAWLLLCALSAHPSTQLPYPDLIRLPELFPMNTTISLDDLRNRPTFNIQRQGMWDIVSIG